MTPNVDSLVETFTTRLDTLEHLLQAGAQHFSKGNRFLQLRLADDMHALGAQVVFTCNQPHNFCLWMQGHRPRDLTTEVRSADEALALLQQTRAQLQGAHADDTALDRPQHLVLGPGVEITLSGHQYVHDFLLPNFYFHLVTAYGILRQAGVPLGKRDYMRHLVKMLRGRD